MRDSQIVEMYTNRDEAAIAETQKKYGSYLKKIAYNILSDREDSEESVNDTYLAAWNAIPPHKPSVLAAFLSKITRRISIDLLRSRTRVKRLISEYTLSLDELGDCVSKDTTEGTVDENLLALSINNFVKALPRDARDAFICRYYFFDSLKDTARTLNMTESKLKSLLYRTRLSLKEHLIKEGFING